MSEVIQADRDAAAEWWVAHYGASYQHVADRIRAGQHPDCKAVQAFAQHRLTHSNRSLSRDREAEVRIAELEKALREGLPHTLAAERAEQARVLLGAQRNPIGKAVARARALLSAPSAQQREG